MKLLGRKILSPLFGLNQHVDVWISNWVSEVGSAAWGHSSQMLEQFPNTQPIGDDRFLFCVCSTSAFLEVKLLFPQRIAVITALIKKS